MCKFYRTRERGRQQCFISNKEKHIVLDIFFEIIDGAGDDEDDEDQSNSEWLLELQEPEGEASQHSDTL